MALLVKEKQDKEAAWFGRDRHGKPALEIGWMDGPVLQAMAEFTFDGDDQAIEFLEKCIQYLKKQRTTDGHE